MRNHLSVDLRESRRAVLGRGCACCVGFAAAWMPTAFAAEPHARTKLGPDEALALLKEGNAKFITDSPVRSAVGRERRLEIARQQTPFAVLVSCSDSRVPPELLFGRGLGELFIVRNAGNTVDTTARGSIENAVSQLGVPLVVVMGHERCGAVAAAVSVVEKNASFPGSLGEMIEPIVPAVLKAQAGGKLKGDELVDAAVRENVKRVVARLHATGPLLGDPLRAGRLKVVGARYDLDDGTVEFFAAS